MAYIDNINPDDYAEESDLRKYYTYNDPLGKPIVAVNEKNHTIRLSKDTNPILSEYILSCIFVFLNINKACTRISTEVWYRRKETGSIDAIAAYKQFNRNYSILRDMKNYEILKDRVTGHKEDIILPDLKYFFETSAWQAYTTEAQENLADEMAQAMAETVAQNNLQYNKDMGGK